MRRWFWAAAIVAALTATQAQAHYIIIRVNIGKGDLADTARGPSTPGSGIPGMAGAGTPAGPGIAGAGGAGKPGGGGPGGNFPGAPAGPGFAGGPGGGRPSGPGSGIGGPPAGMGMGGPPAGMGMGGPRGSAGGPPRGGPGLDGRGNDAPAAAPNEEFDTFETLVIAAIELKDPKPHQNEKYPGLTQWKHAYGQTALYNDGSSIQSFIAPIKTPRARLADMRRATEQSKSKTATDYLNAAEFALTHGLLAECEELIGEAGKQESKNELDKKKLAACAKVLANLNRPSDGQADVSVWEKRLAGYGVAHSDKGHYAVFYTPKALQVPQEVTHRANLLENHMRAFYLWFALKGQALAFPQEKLVAVITGDASSFKAQIEALQVKADGDSLFAPRDNVAIFSNQRLDTGYVTFSNETRSFWTQGWNREELLKGREITNNTKTVRDTLGVKQKDFMKEVYPRMQTLALLEKALEDEAELAAVSHEGTRQLAVASGLFSRNVILPEWLSFGFASVFETPKGPFAGADGSARVAFWPGSGGPSWAYLWQLKQWANTKDELSKLDAPADALTRTVTDVYFQRASKKADLQMDDKLVGSEREKKQKEIKRAKEEIFRAKAHAWALAYYLAKWKLDDFLAFNRELVNSPRDLEMDEQTMLLAFARAFKLTNPEGTAIDQKKFAEFADEWFRVIKREAIPGQDIKLKDPKKLDQGSQPAGPGAPPGGARPPGGPGGGDGRGGPGG